MGKVAANSHRFRSMRRIIFILILFAMVVVAPAADGPALRPPAQGIWWGAYMDFGETEDSVTLEGILRFEKLAHARPAIIASSSYWGENTFPVANLGLIQRHGAMAMVYWSPWDKPYKESQGPDRFSLTRILDGDWNEYIDRWADGAVAFGEPFFVSFCNEMNGDWFPWSGVFYGRENGGSEIFKRAWRYVVDRVRARGAWNVTWVFHVNNFPAINEDWNAMKAYYPGSDYVDWLGLSVYGKQFHQSGDWAFFRDLLDWPYKEISALDPGKPIMLAEFGVGEFPKAGSKAQWISDAFHESPKYPRIKAAIFWHERWQNDDGTYSNLRLQSSAAALEAFRAAVKLPPWQGAPPRPADDPRKK